MESALTTLHVEPGINGRRAERFIVNRAARLMSVGINLQGMTVRSCQVADISKLGATLMVMTTIGLPDHYYLNIIGTADRIGCAEVYRNGTRVGVKFIKAIDESLLSAIIRGDFFTR